MGYNTIFVTNQALNAGSTSQAHQVLDGKVYSVQTVFTGSTCHFSAKIQICSDAYVNTAGYNPPDAHFSDLDNSSITFTQAGNFNYNVNVVGYNWVRLVLTDLSSGSNNGTLTATLNVKN